TVADSIPRRRSDDRELAERRNGKLSDPLHRLEKERPLRLSRRRRLEVTPVAPRARFPGSADPVARRDEDLDGATPPEGAPLFLDFRLDFLTRQRAGHEADAMLPTRDSLAGGSEPGNTDATAGGGEAGLSNDCCGEKKSEPYPPSSQLDARSVRRGSASSSRRVRRIRARRVFSSVSRSILTRAFARR